MMESLINLPLPAQLFLSGLIIAILSSLVSALTTYWMQRTQRRKQEQAEQLETAKKYAKPIVESLVSLGYRLREIFNSRHSFLLHTSATNKFNEYKLITTIYRLCAVLGWLRAYKKEHLYFDYNQGDYSKQVDVAISRFRKFIADGHEVELLRVNNLVRNFWGESTVDSIDEVDKANLGFLVETKIDKFTSEINPEYRLANQLNSDDQLILLRELLDLINSRLKKEVISDDIIKEKRVSSIQSISIISTMIYREWQDAIGEFMINTVEGAPIRYEVKSYREFEQYYKNDFSFEKNEWMLRIHRLFYDLDVDTDNQYDVRRTQLLNIYTGIVELLDVISNLDLQIKSIIEEHLLTFREHLNRLGPP